MGYELIDVTEPADWAAYHDIRRQELFEARGRSGVYNPQYPGEYLPGMHHYLLRHDGVPIGTTRLDIGDDGSAIFRLVAITATAQGKGHGRMLEHLVTEQARALGVGALYVNAANTALGFYAATGWHEHVWDVEELADMADECTQMRKLLQVAPHSG